MTPEQRQLYLKKILEGAALSTFRAAIEAYIEEGLLNPQMSVTEALAVIGEKLTDLAQEVVILQAPPDLEESVREFFSAETGRSSVEKQFYNPKLGVPHDKKKDDS